MRFERRILAKPYRTTAMLKHLKGFGPDGRDITGNQVLHWIEVGILKASIKEAAGHASSREYALSDLLRAGIIGKLLGMGKSVKEVGARLDEFTKVKCLSNQQACSLWDVLGKKSEREWYRYYFEFGYRHGSAASRIEAGIELDWGFCSGVHEIIGLLTRGDRPIHLSALKMVDLLEVLETLESRTGDSL